MVDLSKYRGVLWKKLKEKEEKISSLPGFYIEEAKEFAELPVPKNISEIDFRYPLIEPFAYAHIRWDPAIEQMMYQLEEPPITEDEKKILKKLHSALIDLIQVGLTSVRNTQEATKYLEEQVKRAISHLGITLSPEQYTKFMYYIYRDFVGFNEIEPVLRDPYIEDIGCDGVGFAIYIVHRKYGSIKTNIIYNDLGDLKEFVVKLAERTGRYVSYAEPILDGTLPDGSRVNASLAGDVTTRGPTFSIRKFAEKPFSPIDLIELGTATPELMAYFWFLVENGASILIAGGVATGKTTFLNSICMFIPPESKIVSIEDSITEDTEIVIKRGNKIEIVKIGNLVDDLLSKGGSTEKVTNKTGIEVLSLDGNYKMVFKKAGSFLRHRVKKDIYEITTSTGRKVKVTRDHSLFGLDGNGRIVPVTPEELKKLRFLAVPRIIPWEGKEWKTINLLEHLDAFKGDFIKGPLEQLFKKHCFDEFKKLGIPQQRYRYWKKHNIIETSVFKKMIKNSTEVDLQKLHIIGKRESRPIPVLFEVSDEFLEFLGLWVGDGSYDKYNKNRVIIFNVDEECINCVKKIADKLGIKITVMSDDVSMSLNSTLLYKLMLALGFKGYADTKRVPGFIFNLSQKQVAAFLRGYFSADGTVKNSEIACSSQSLGLLNDIQTLFLRFGIISRISHYPRKDKCRELLISSNENVTKFKNIGFLQERKVRKIDILSTRKATHATTDVIPLGTGLLGEINKFHKLSWSYQQGIQNIGRPFLGYIGEDADSEIVGRLVNSDILWDKIKEVNKLPKQEIYVYDISVPETENFVGANILLHNTRELRLTHDHWIPTVSRLGFGIPLPTGEKYGEITLFDLLKGSFRQNPDYVIVGEVRGKEAYVMFQGMSSGHPSFATFHAGSVDTVIKRLTTPPIELSASLVESLDLITIMVHAKERGKSARRLKTVEEIISVDSAMLQANVFKSSEWDPATDEYKVILDGSHLLKKLSHTKGIDIEDAVKEIEKKKAVLVWMFKNGIKNFEEVGKIINEFSKNPRKVLERIGKIDLAKEEAEIEKKRLKIKVSERIKDGGELQKIEGEAEMPIEEDRPDEELKSEEDVYKMFGYKIVKEKIKAEA